METTDGVGMNGGQHSISGWLCSLTAQREPQSGNRLERVAVWQPRITLIKKPGRPEMPGGVGGGDLGPGTKMTFVNGAIIPVDGGNLL